MKNKEYVSMGFIEKGHERFLKGLLYSSMLLITGGIIFLWISLLINISMDSFWFTYFLAFYFAFYVSDFKIGFVENMFIKKKKEEYKNFYMWFGIMEGYFISKKELNKLLKNEK